MDNNNQPTPSTTPPAEQHPVEPKPVDQRPIVQEAHKSSHMGLFVIGGLVVLLLIGVGWLVMSQQKGTPANSYMQPQGSIQQTTPRASSQADPTVTELNKELKTDTTIDINTDFKGVDTDLNSL